MEENNELIEEILKVQAQQTDTIKELLAITTELTHRLFILEGYVK